MPPETVGGPFGGAVDADSDTLGETFYPLYKWLFDENAQFVIDLERKLSESRMTTTVEMYLARALGVGVLSGFLLWTVGILGGYTLFASELVVIDTVFGLRVSNDLLRELVLALRIPLLILVMGIVLGAIGFTASFGTYVAIPYSRSTTREREINMLLPDAVSYMYALSIGGLNQIEILQSMAQAEDTYGEISREFQSIVQETEYFDTDYRTAMRNQSLETPSSDLSQFLTDMLSIINSGGDMTRFLDDKKEKHLRTAKRQQQTILETLEVLGELYMTLALFPLLLIIVLVIMALLGRANHLMLYATVYGLIPVTGVAFLVLVSTFKWDEPGDGFLALDDDAEDQSSAQESRSSLLHRGLVEAYVGVGRIFDRIKTREDSYETFQLLRKPHVFFREHPYYTLAITVPAAGIILAVAVLTGSVPVTPRALIDQPVWGTFIFVYAPFYVIGLPFAVFYAWNLRSRHAVLHNLSDNLRKLSSANDTGLTLLDSIRLVGETTPGKLAEEFDIMYAKVKYGMSLKEALIAFNNAYHIPRLARTVRLISKAQEASNQITSVLRTAAQTSENQDEIDSERVSRTRVQLVVIIMTFLTLLAVIAILKTQFIDVMAGLSSQSAESGGGGGFTLSVDTNLLSLLFFHAVTIQAILSGLISGYIREGTFAAGMKYMIALMTIALAVWMLVG